MTEPHQYMGRFRWIMQVIFESHEGEITCEDCYNEVDHYVDMLRAGHDPSEILPHVREHLGHCLGCDEEFRAFITILEAQIKSGDSSDG